MSDTNDTNFTDYVDTPPPRLQTETHGAFM